jgi:DNA transformation protein and related proteins
VDVADIEDAFAPFGRVDVRRMFSGHGVYADGVFFAMANAGEFYLKTDAALAQRLEAAGSRPFSYARADRSHVLTSLWTLPPTALEDDRELVELAGLALAAARRKAAGKKAGKSGAPRAGRKR